jgi:predicted dehydrogenase
MRVAVVGLGPMGMHHVRAMADIPGARLTAVVDIDRGRADDTAKTFNCLGLYSTEELIGAADAAVIATPPEHHAAALPLLRGGIHCLIEKPLAMNEGDCAAIMTAAAAGNSTVAVGHVERFNPAFDALLAENIPPAAIQAMRVQRLSPAGGRPVATDVVSDMMIHDIDIVLALKGNDLVSTVGYGSLAEHASATLLFRDRAVAEITAHRKAETRVRTLELKTAAHTYVLDFMARTLTKDGAARPVTERDALRAEIGDFLGAVRAKSAPRVTAEHALNAMRATWAILDEMRGCQA